MKRLINLDKIVSLNLTGQCIELLLISGDIITISKENVSEIMLVGFGDHGAYLAGEYEKFISSNLKL